MAHMFHHDTQINVAELTMTANRPWSMRASIRQTYMTEGGAIIWQNRRLVTGYSCVSSVEPGETQYSAVYRSAVWNTARHPDVSPRPRLSRRDKRSVPVKAPGLHIDLPRDSVSSVRISPCRRMSSSGSSMRRSTPRWIEFHVARIDDGFTVNPRQVINYSCIWRSDNDWYNCSGSAFDSCDADCLDYKSEKYLMLKILK